MNLDDKWFDLYESLYGTTFNRILTIGTISEGYENYPITTLDALKEYYEKNCPNKELYISLYDYDTDDLAIKWNPLDSTPYEQFSIKNCILFRLRANTDSLQEEISELNKVQKFMFIRRTMNLGSNKPLIEDAKKVHDTIKEIFNLETWTLFNGYDECYLYLFTDRLDLKVPMLTYFYLYEFIEKKANVSSLSYSKINPFSQLIALPGSQNNHTRLYNRPYNVNMDYQEILKNSENKILTDADKIVNQDTSKLSKLIEKVDGEINKVKFDENLFNLVDLFEFYTE